MVGDTKSDMLLARNARVGLGVGVLSGWGTLEQMQLYTDVFIESAESVRDLLSGEVRCNVVKVIESTDETTPTIQQSKGPAKRSKTHSSKRSSPTQQVSE